MLIWMQNLFSNMFYHRARTQTAFTLVGIIGEFLINRTTTFICEPLINTTRDWKTTIDSTGSG